MDGWYNVSIDTIVVETQVNYFDNCVKIDFVKNAIIAEEGIEIIYIYPNSESTVSFEIVPVDRKLFTDRNSKFTKLYNPGDDIILERGAPNGFRYERYDNIVEMKQDIFVENDPSKSCRSYPNEDLRTTMTAIKTLSQRPSQSTLVQTSFLFGPLSIWAR